MNEIIEPKIKYQTVKKAAILVSVAMLVLISTFAFAVLYHEDSVERVEFSLLNQKGITTTEKDMGDSHLIVTFGFTNCPDICPTQLQKMTRIMKNLEESGKDKLVKAVFITIDPERDTPEKLDSYLGYFHESILGLTGSRLSIKPVTDFFNTLFPNPPKDTEKNYYVAHSSQIYIVSPKGRIVDHISFNVKFDDVMKKVNSFL